MLFQRHEIHVSSQDVIDHDRLNNTMSNLRAVSRAFNNHNRTKHSGCHSTYIGVTKSRAIWYASTQDIVRGFRSEECAAFCYDQWALSKWGSGANINNMSKPENYEDMKVQGPRKRTDDKCIQLLHGKFRVQIKGNKPAYGLFETIADARTFRDSVFEGRIEKDLQITRNKDGVACVVCKGKEVLMDDDVWQRFHKSCGVIPALKEYCQVKVNGKTCSLHVAIFDRLGKFDGKVIDRIDGNGLKNTRSNLRVVTHSENAQNRKGYSRHTKFKGCKKKHRGRWEAYIAVNKQRYYLGIYGDEKVSAYAYNCKARELYPEGARLNDVDKPDGFIWESDRLVKS